MGAVWAGAQTAEAGGAGSSTKTLVPGGTGAQAPRSPARALGYPALGRLLGCTPRLPAKRLAVVLGAGHSSIKRWRAANGVPDQDSPR